MTTLQEQQAPIDAEIINAMVASTPEAWNVIRLVIERTPGATRSLGDFLHTLSSPEGHPPVGAELALFDATLKLDTLLQAHGATLRRAEYLAHLEGVNWKFTCAFAYEDGRGGA